MNLHVLIQDIFTEPQAGKPTRVGVSQSFPVGSFRRVGAFPTYRNRFASPAPNPSGPSQSYLPVPGLSSRSTGRFSPVTESRSSIARPTNRSPLDALDSPSTVPNALKST